MTLNEFLIEKNIISSDPINDILDYYTYFDVLFVQTSQSIISSESALTNDEILSCIVSWSQKYTLKRLVQVNKQLLRIVGKLHIDKTHHDEQYLFDAIRNMNWWHMSRAPAITHDTLYQSLIIAVENGYELGIRGPDVEDNSDECDEIHEYCSGKYPLYYELLEAVASNSNLTDRYFNLFVTFCKYAVTHDEWSLFDDGESDNDVYYACIKGGDERMFEYLYELIGEQNLNKISRMIQETCYYGRVNMMKLLLASHNIKSLNGDVDIYLTVAYMGGCYKIVSEFIATFTDYVPTDRLILHKILRSSTKYKLVNLDLLIDLVTKCPECDTMSVLNYSINQGVEFTLNEFKRLWSVVGNVGDPTGLIVTLMVNYVNFDIATFVLNQYSRSDIRLSEIRDVASRGFEGVREWIEKNFS